MTALRGCARTLAFIGAGSAAILTIPPVRRVLDFAPLGWTELSGIALVGTTLLLAFEATKRRLPAGQADPNAGASAAD